jgi:hypothetical protein
LMTLGGPRRKEFCEPISKAGSTWALDPNRRNANVFAICDGLMTWSLLTTLKRKQFSETFV